MFGISGFEFRPNFNSKEIDHGINLVNNERIAKEYIVENMESCKRKKGFIKNVI